MNLRLRQTKKTLQMSLEAISLRLEPLTKMKSGRKKKWFEEEDKEYHFYFIVQFICFCLCWVLLSAQGFSVVMVSGAHSLFAVCGLLT